MLRQERGETLLHGLGCSQRHPPMILCGIGFVVNLLNVVLLGIRTPQEAALPYRAALQIAAPGWLMDCRQPAATAVRLNKRFQLL